MGTGQSDDPVRVLPQGKRGGIWVTFGEEQYRIPPVGFAVLKTTDFQADLAVLSSITGVLTPVQLECAERFIHAAMVRNYPDMTLEQVSDMLDFGNVVGVLTATLGESGFKPGGAGPGGVVASTGTASTSP